MKLITYRSSTGSGLGVARGEEAIPLLGLDMLALIDAGPAGLEQARAAAGPALPLAGLELLAPIPNPRRNVFCVGLNYLAHAREGAAARGRELRLPSRPVFFTKATTAVAGPFADVPLDAAVTNQLDWEVELAFVIGRRGKNIPRSEAMGHVFGYMVVNDLSARDVQSGHGGQFFKGKSLDGTCPCGPCIVTRDGLPDPHRLRLLSRVNGVLKQDSNTSDFLFDIPALIEWLSLGLTLLPGDIVATGTPSGVGFARTPPEFLHPGDVVECEIEGIGRICNRIVPVKNS